MRRGMTLLELLLAMGLLSGIAAAGVPLTQAALSGLARIDQKLLWQRSAEMTLGEIDRLLLRRERGDTSPLTTDSNRLTIRVAGGAAIALGLDGRTLRLHAEGQPSRTVIGDLHAVEITLDEGRQILSIGLTALDGETLHRTWELSP